MASSPRVESLPSNAGATEPDAGHRGTATLIAGALDIGCGTYFARGLSSEERARLEADLAPVLAKHNAPSIKAAEELQLLVTVGSIVVPRWQEKRERERIEAEALAAEAGQQDHGDIAQRRDEGLREKHAAPPTDIGVLSRAGSGSAPAADLVS